MGFMSSPSAALFLSLNLFFFACALASEYAPYYSTPDSPDTPTSYSPKPTPSVVNPPPFYPEHTPTLDIPAPLYAKQPTPTPSNPALSNIGQPTPSHSKCSRDTLKLGACAKLLNGPIDVVLGRGTSKPCCALIDGLIDTQVGVCLCTALKANVLGIKLDVNVALSVLVNTCGKKIPPSFKCA